MARAEVAFWGAVGFLLGLALTGLHFSFFIILILSAGILFVLKISRPERLLEFSVAFAAVILAFVYYHAYWSARDSNEQLPSGDAKIFSLIVRSESMPSGEWQMARATFEEPWRGEVRIRVPSQMHIAYGDKISIKGTLLPRRTERELPFLSGKTAEVIAHNQGNKIIGILMAFKQRVADTFRAALPPDEAALLSGLTFGIRSDFTPGFQEDMKRSGTTHLVALSGYNVAVLIIAIETLLRHYVSRHVKFALTGIILLFFVLMVGAEASIVRAAIMGVLILIAKEAGRPHTVRNVISLTAVFMTVINPGVLFELGFLLSFVSLIGIVLADALFAPTQESGSRLSGERREKDLLEWKEGLRTTLAAQTAVAPILIGSFGLVSLLAVFSNILILPFVPLVMFLGFLLGAVSLVAQELGFFFVLFVKLILKYMIGVIHFFSSHTILLNLTVNPFFFALSYYILLAFIIFYVRIRKKA